MLLPDGDEVEAIAPSHVPLMDFFKELLPKCCHAHSTTHGTGPSRKLSNIRYLRPTMVLPILIGTSGNVAAGTHVKPRGRQPGHYRRADLKTSSFAVGTARHATFEAGVRRLICDSFRIRGREHEHPRKDRIDCSRHYAD